MADLHIDCFGKLCVRDGRGREISIAGTKTQALLACLALSLDRPQHRRDLATLLWGSRFETQARQSLRQSLRTLRAALSSPAPHALICDGPYVVLDGRCVWVDALEAAKAVAAGLDDEALAILTPQPLLLGLEIGDERKFSSWIAAQRRHFTQIACVAAGRAVDRHARRGEFAEAIEAGRALVALDPVREDSQRLLIGLYERAGRPAEAIAQYNQCADILRTRLGIGPHASTAALRNAILHGRRKPGAVSSHPFRCEDMALAVSAAPTRRTTSIAILPFEDLDGGYQSGQLAKALVFDLTTELSRFHWLSVSSRTVRNNTDTVRSDFAQVAAELEVRYLLAGSVRRGDRQIRISMRLVDSVEGIHVWCERFDLDLASDFGAQDHVLSSMVRSIESAIISAEWRTTRQKAAGSLDAWDHYVQGIWNLFRFSVNETIVAHRAFRTAIEHDPDFASPLIGLAYTARLLFIFDHRESLCETLDEGLEAARRAVFIDDRDFFARTILGRLYMLSHEYELAISQSGIALELNPNAAQAHFGLGLARTMAGKAKEATESLEKAVELGPRDPNLPTYASLLSMTHILLQDHRRAIDWAQVAIRQPQTHFVPQMNLTAALGLVGDKLRSEAARTKLLRLKPDFSLDYVARTWAFKNRSDTTCYLRGLRRAGISH